MDEITAGTINYQPQETVAIEVTAEQIAPQPAPDTTPPSVEEKPVETSPTPEPTPAIEDPNRNEKGQFIEGNTANAEAENKGGRPCEYCPRHNEIMQKVNLYVEFCRGKVDQKIHIPYIEELCGYDYLDMIDATFVDWCHNDRPMPHDPNHTPAFHAELNSIYKRIFQNQKLFLLKRTLGAQNPTGAIFQLKANHGLIEAEKKILVGEKNSDPLQIEIIEERPKADD